MLAIIGLIVGILVGVFWNISIPIKYAPYISVTIFSCIDSIFGGARASITKNFRADIFLSGFFGNSILAVLLVFLGDQLGLPIYLAAVVVFGSRIFNNFSIIRRILIDKIKYDKR